ncbi:MAG: DUF418 domain-containing protein [Ilumatobacter sp.]
MVVSAAAADSMASVPPSESVERLPGPDVVRALALIGVVVMNYHGYLIIRGTNGTPDATAVERFFNPFNGPLSTRFAATFVLMAGVGITLLTRRVVAARTAAGNDPMRGPAAARAVTEMRWRLVRRGMALYVLGQILEIIWNGTIILYYGAMFVIASLLFTLASRWLAVIGIAAALAGWWISVWSFQQVEDGSSVAWLTRPGTDSIRRYVFELFVNGTHPLLPWMAFLCAGMVVGRYLAAPEWRLWCGGLGFSLFALAALVSGQATTPFTQHLLSTVAFDRGLMYVASALGTALIALAGLSWLADQATGIGAEMIDPLRRAGQMTLTLYIAHILLFNLVVDWLGLVDPAGLGTALAFAFGFWVVAITAGALWHQRFGRGPAERIYRSIGG